jgi:hypothetical protein
MLTESPTAPATRSLPATPSARSVLETRLGVVTVLAVCALFIAGMKGLTFHEPVRGDQSVYAVIAHELLNGRQLYADLWDHKPPALHATFALAELVFGYGPMQVYLLHLLALLVTLWGLYRVGAVLGGPRAGLCAGVVWAFASVFPHWEGYQPNAEGFLDVFLVWGVYFLCRLNQAPAWWRACAFGAMIGMASLYKQVVIAPAGLLAFTYVFGPGREAGSRGRAFLHMLVAGAVGLLIWVGCFAWFWAQGTFGDFYDAVFVYNRYYAGSMHHNLMAARYWGHKSYLIAVALPCLLAPFAGTRLAPAQRNGWAMLSAWAVGCFIGQALPGRWQEHYLEIWMPVYALAVGGLFAGLVWGQFDRPRALRWALLLLAVAPLAIRATQPNQFNSAPWLAYEPGSDEYTYRYSSREAALDLKEMLAPGERLYALGTPGESAPVYFYTQQRPPSGVFYDFPLRAGRPLAHELEVRIVNDLERDPPDLLALASNSFGPAFGPEGSDWGQRLVAWVTPRYVRRGFDPTHRYLLFARRGSALAQRLPEGPTHE